MPNRKISTTLKIHSSIATVSDHVVKIPFAEMVDNPYDADFIINPEADLSFDGIDINAYNLNRKKIFSIPPSSVYLDLQSCLYFLMQKQSVTSNIAIVSFHEFIRNESFELFYEMYKEQSFDLIMLNSNRKYIVESGLLSTIVSNNSALLEETLIEDVAFSSTTKYLLRKSKIPNKTYYKVIGSIGIDDLNTRTFSTNIPMHRDATKVVRQAFGRHHGFFEIEYSFNIGKLEIYSFSYSLHPDLLINGINLLETRKHIDLISSNYVFGDSV